MTTKLGALRLVLALAVLTTLIAVTLVHGLPRLRGMLGDPVVQRPAPSDRATRVPVAGDYYRIVGVARREHRPAVAGRVEYCPLDQFGRAACAFGELTGAQRRAAKMTGRQEIEVEPAGWPRANPEVEIPALAGVRGSRAYRGRFYNRSHLVADSVGGDAARHNLVTGTRTQNVGSVNNSGGMAFTETIARGYLDRTVRADACPLYYAAAPVYLGDEPLPRLVVVDVQSCDKAIDLRVEVVNAAQGWAIDYATGAHSRKS